MPAGVLDAVAEFFVGEARADLGQTLDDLLVPDAVDASVLQLPVWVQQCAGAVEVDEADADVFEEREGGQSLDGLEDQAFKRADEDEVVDAGAVGDQAAQLVHDRFAGFRIRLRHALSTA